jgi:hypothetical protein
MSLNRNAKRRYLLSVSFWWSLLVGLIFTLASAACDRLSLFQQAVPTSPVVTPTQAPALELSRLPVPTPSATHTPTRLPTSLPTATLTSTPSPTITPIPTYTILRGEVLLRSNCRYGPGAPYLYKYGLVIGSNLEVIGRNDLGTWILVRAIGGNNPCWVKASLMEVKGDVMSVEPTYIPLPQSPYYAPPEWVYAKRNGDEVTIFWSAVAYRAGDETASPPYLVEAWTCTNGQLVFTPNGSYETAIEIIDEPGCSEPSHGRLYFVEKHGYSNWIKIPWPPF